MRNHVLLRSGSAGQCDQRRGKTRGRVSFGSVLHVARYLRGNPKGFNTVLRNRRGQVFPWVHQVAFEEGLTLEVSLPQKPAAPFDTVIYRNGERMLTSNSQVTQYFLNQPGVYRVMVRVIPTLPIPDGKKWIPWIYTNPFYVGVK